MLWLGYSIGAIFFFTILNLMQRRLAADSKFPRALAVLFNFFAAISALIIFFVLGSFRNFSLPTDTTAWVFLLLACCMYALFERGRFLAAGLLDASVLATVINFSLLISFIGSVFLYSESITPYKIVGFLLIFSSLFVVSYAKDAYTKISRKGLVVAIIISVFLGIAWTLDKRGTSYFNVTTYNILVWMIPVLLIYLPYVPVRQLKSEIKTSSWKIFILAFINVIGYLFQLQALALGQATQVLPVFV